MVRTAVALLITCAGATAGASGSIYGTLLWTGDQPPEFRARFCEGVHSDRFEGLADVVVIAEPLDAAGKHARGGDSELEWYDDRIVVGSADPHSTLTITNLAHGPRTLRMFDGTKVVRELAIASMGHVDVTGLPEGVLHVTEADRPGSEGWIYVTPWPSAVTGGNCRWIFEVPLGRYRVHAWHPFGGERSVACTARKTSTPPPCPLTFDARTRL